MSKADTLAPSVAPPEEARARGLTARSVLLALGLLAVVSVAGFYADLLVNASTRFNAGVPATSPFFLLFLLTAVTTLGPVGRRLRFSRRELLTIYAIVVAGAPLVSHGILGYMIPHEIYQQYGARRTPQWATTFLQFIPRWSSPTDLKSVEDFFVGGAAVPWTAWWLPLAAWSSFLVALVTSAVCLTALIQRQWISNERLAFPLAQIPLEVASESEEPGGRRRARLPVARLFWLGFALSFGVQFWNGLGAIFSNLPQVPLGPLVVLPAQTTGPLAAVGDLEVTFWPSLIGIAYMIPKELSFSCWVFYIIRVLEAMVAITFGATPRSATAWLGDTMFPSFAFQGFGAILALSAWAAWRARRHLKNALRIALSRDSGRADAEEPIPYRWAFLGLALSFAWMVYFFWLGGAGVVVAIIILAVLLMLYMMWAWIRAETGLGLLLFPSFIDDMMDGFGSGVLRPGDIVMIMSIRWTYFNGNGSNAHLINGNVLESFKIADQARLPTRPLFRWMAIGFFLALLIGIYVTLTGMYHYGFYGLRLSRGGFWLSSQLNWGAAHIYYALTEPTKLDWNAVAGTAAGASVAVVLGLMRARFWWWPFHPVGYLAANSWGMHWFYMPFFIGWVAKSLATRYGGLRLYRATLPLAIGLVAGELMNEMLWIIYKMVVFFRI